MIDIRDRTPSGKNYSGLRLENICNRDRAGEGIQLELSSDLLHELLNNVHFLDRFSKVYRNFASVIGHDPEPRIKGWNVKKEIRKRGSLKHLPFKLMPTLFDVDSGSD